MKKELVCFCLLMLMLLGYEGMAFAIERKMAVVVEAPISFLEDPKFQDMVSRTMREKITAVHGNILSFTETQKMVSQYRMENEITPYQISIEQSGVINVEVVPTDRLIDIDVKNLAKVVHVDYLIYLQVALSETRKEPEICWQMKIFAPNSGSYIFNQSVIKNDARLDLYDYEVEGHSRVNFNKIYEQSFKEAMEQMKIDESIFSIEKKSRSR